MNKGNEQREMLEWHANEALFSVEISLPPQPKDKRTQLKCIVLMCHVFALLRCLVYYTCDVEKSCGFFLRYFDWRGH